MELKKIKYFLRIVDAGSLSKAAESLYLTQPTLSRFLAKLEEEAGVPLFTRSKNGTLELTQCGKAYLEAARKIDALWKALDAELSACRRDQADRIVLGVDGDHLLPFAASCADQVTKQYPHIRVELLCESALSLQELVAQGKLDLGVAAFARKDDRLTWLACQKQEMDLVTAPGHPLAIHSCQLPGREGHRLRLSQLSADTPFALMRSHTVLREMVEQYLQAMQLSLHVKTTYMRHGSLPEILSGGELLGFCPRSNTSRRLVHIALDPPFYYNRGICYARGRQLTAPEKLLIKCLKSHPIHRSLD